MWSNGLPAFGAADALLAAAVADSAFPCAVAEVGSSHGSIWQTAHGTLSGDADSPVASPQTVFDLASLTKVLATAPLAMRLVDAGRLGLDERVADRIDRWRGTDREGVTVRDLLSHTSGLPAHAPLYTAHEGRQAFADAICAMPLEYEPRSQATYSDLGFILLGLLLEDAGGRRLDEQMTDVASLTAPGRLAFKPPVTWREQVAPTGVDSWRGRLLAGEVHDGNAWALGGRAGHAGLFGDHAGVGAFARLVLRALRDDDASIARPATMREFSRRREIPNSTRALGWDTMKATSSCGTRMSASAIGHTGFTGTSIWIDWERNLYAVLLSNRVHPTATNNAILQVRRAFHDCVVDAWDAAHATGARP
jgi:CubicO group peptidase (beta-lactamase class C family)